MTIIYNNLTLGDAEILNYIQYMYSYITFVTKTVITKSDELQHLADNVIIDDESYLKSY